VYRPTEKKFYTYEDVENSFNIKPENFLLYKCLLGDNSDNVKGIKGLGKKTLAKRLPELANEEIHLGKLHSICEEKLTTNISYARILDDFNTIEKNYKIMNLKDPMVTEQQIQGVKEIIAHKELNYYPEEFESLHNVDKLGNLIRNPQHWFNQYFNQIYKISKQ
jgi:DNA polymerase-1